MAKLKKVFSISDSLTKGMQEAVLIGLEHAGELHVEFIPINRLETDPDNPREFLISINDLQNGIDPTDPLAKIKNNELESIQSLSHSILKHGVINPVIVYRHFDNYRLIAGERRTLASILSGKDSIPARIYERKPDALNLTLLQWVENNERADLTLWEKHLNLKAIVEAFRHENNCDSITPKELSDLIGCSQPYAFNLKLMIEAPADVLEPIQKNKIKSIDKVVVLARINNKLIRQKAISACIQGASLDDLKKYVAEDKVNKDEQTLKRRAGRPNVNIALGVSSKPMVVNFILNVILNHPKLNSIPELCHIIQELNEDENNPKHMASVFKKVISFLDNNQNVIG